MKLIPVEVVPGRSAMKNLSGYIDEFVAMDVETVEVRFNENEYKSPKAAYTAFFNAIKKNNHPIKVMTRRNKVYLTKIR